MLPYRFITQLLFITFCLIITTANAEWSGGGDFSTYYTDDVALFSVTRRLSLDQDPTQPVVDEAGQGNDFVYEPHGYINWLTENQLGAFKATFDAGVYVFQDNSAYTHGFFKLEIDQALTEKTRLKLFYDYVPDQFIGEHALSSSEDRHTEHVEAEERLDSHMWALHLEHELSEQFMLRGLVRYGLRNYDEPFAHRDIQFFTVGSHLEWIISQDVELLVGYHFERGYTDHAKTKYFGDDIGYINHYASAELILDIIPKLKMKLIADYEHNDFTGPYTHDIHYDGTENVYQGELELLYELTHAMTLKAGWQHGKRKFNYESHWVDNNNGWVGVEFHY